MYQIENKGSEECGAMPSDVDDASALPAQLGRNELDRVLEARVHGDGDKEAAGHGQQGHQHGRT
jgi:hypothetical protein